jgi:hypothetical protein
MLDNQGDVAICGFNFKSRRDFVDANREVIHAKNQRSIAAEMGAQRQLPRHFQCMLDWKDNGAGDGGASKEGRAFVAVA